MTFWENERQSFSNFSVVKENVENGDASYRLRFPHAVLVGVNHASYTTGQMPERVVRFFIESELDLEQSTASVANATLPFVSYVTSVRKLRRMYIHATALCTT